MSDARDKPAVTPFEREHRYIVLKRSHMSEGTENDLNMVIEGLGLDPIDAVVVEADWPEFEPVWRMIEDRVSGVAREQAGGAAPIARPEIKGASDAEAWQRFDRLPYRIKAKAERRMAALMEVEAQVFAGMGRTAASQVTARKHGVSLSTIGAWRALVKGVTRHNWLPHLVPQYKGGKEKEIDPQAWRLLLSDYLRPARPTFAACYRRIQEGYATPRGIRLPHPRTLKRRLAKEASNLSSYGAPSAGDQ